MFRVLTFSKKKRKKMRHKKDKEKYLCHVEKGDDKDQHPKSEGSARKERTERTKSDDLLLFFIDERRRIACVLR